jgi:hypothetical protein
MNRNAHYLSSHGVFDCVEIEKPQKEIPQTVADAYSRHFWYSQHCLTDFYLVRIPVESQISFALLVQGYVDDGWDNSGWFIEIFDEHGQFLGAGRCDYEAGDVRWLEEPLKGSDFNSGSPEWIIGNESSSESVPQRMWSEELFVEHGATVTQEGVVTSYIMPNGD